MPYNETDPISTKDVIDQIRNKNLDGARDGTKTILYKKSGEAMAAKKTEVQNTIGKPNTDLDAEIAIDVAQEPTTGE